MIGDFFGNGGLQITLTPPATTINSMVTGFAFPASGNEMDFFNANVPLVFSVSPNGPPLLTTGAPGIDASGDGVADTFPIDPATGLPPALTPVPPGAGTITFLQGNLVFTRGGPGPADGAPDPPPGATNPQGGYLLSSRFLFQPAGIVIDAPNPSGGGSVGRLKIAENNSPLPRDRVFHNYSYFDSVPLTRTGVNVNRFIPGFEKTFFGGVASVEMRFPFAASLNSTIIADGVTGSDDIEFGNINIPLKLLLYRNDQVAFSCGMAVALPTADDTVVQLANGTPLVRIDNESVHLMPFLGLLLTPNDRFFTQGFLQFDFDTQGNPVQVTNLAGGLVPVGRSDQVTFMYVDLGVGYWLKRSDNPSGLTGIAPTLEVHWNQALDDFNPLQAGPIMINSNSGGRFESVNMVFGTMLQWGQNTTLTLGYATPLSGGLDREFDGEVRVLFNHRFGPQNRASRVQF